MAYRWHPKNAEVDPDNPKAWGSCDRCGMIWQLDQLTWQYAYQGSSFPINTNFLVCPKHLDPLNPQDMPYILPPDPPPVFNARPEPYMLDETSWLSTQDGDVILTQSGQSLITPIPNPSDAPAFSDFIAFFSMTDAALPSSLYLDIFNGDPLGGGGSVLSLLTGSATRTNVASQLAEYNATDVWVNPDVILLTTSALAQTNTNYAAFYDAASGGTLLMSTPMSSHYTVAEGNQVQFLQLDLRVTFVPVVQDLLWGADFLSWDIDEFVWSLITL